MDQLVSDLLFVFICFVYCYVIVYSLLLQFGTKPFAGPQQTRQRDPGCLTAAKTILLRVQVFKKKKKENA